MTTVLQDVHKTGMRREVVFQAVMACINWLFYAALPPLLLIGLGLCGFDAANCTGFEADSDEQKVFM